MTMNTTLVINAKGGVGKTTITTNLAAYFASRDITTTIADFDPQGSSLNWLQQRSKDARKIYGADLATRLGSGFANGRRLIPRDTKQLIVDAPAGPGRLLLQDLLALTQSILIPVAPSSIDVHATANFIKELLLVGHVRFRNIRVAVIANRVRNNKPVYAPLEKFVASLGITFLGRVSDSDVYVDAAETGSRRFRAARRGCRCRAARVLADRALGAGRASVRRAPSTTSCRSARLAPANG